MECIELNRLCKHMKKVRSSQAAIFVLNWVKHSFSLWVSLIHLNKEVCCISDVLWDFFNNWMKVLVKIIRTVGNKAAYWADYRSSRITLFMYFWMQVKMWRFWGFSALNPSEISLVNKFSFWNLDTTLLAVFLLAVVGLYFIILKLSLLLSCLCASLR